MAYDAALERELLLRNALRLGVATYARNQAELTQAIRARLLELGFVETAICSHCCRKVPELPACPYCSAPRSNAVQFSQAAVFEWLSLRALVLSASRPVFWVVVTLATAPMILKFFGLTEKWMFVYFSLLWAYVFFRLTGTRADLWRAAMAGYVSTGVVALPLLVVWIASPPHMTETLTASPNPFLRWVGFTFGVGVREELAKVLAVAWMSRLRYAGRPVLSVPSDALVVGSICGLGFAAVENMDYLERFQFLDKVNYTFGFYGDNLSFRGSMSRLMLTPFVHAVWSGIFAFFLVLGMQYRASARRQLIVIGLGLAAGLHGLYDVVSTLPQGELFVLVAVALSFAIWHACLEPSERVRRISVKPGG